MAFLSEVQRQCNELNRKNRNVNESNSALILSRFWASALRNSRNETVIGNFLITCGTESDRNIVLQEAVCAYRRGFAGPIIILNGDDKCENNLIRLFDDPERKRRLGGLRVSSPRYRNYNLFAGMDSNSIRGLFMNQAQRSGRDPDAVGNYTQAILQVAGARYRDSLTIDAMGQLYAQGTDQIAAFGAAHGVSDRFLNTIRNEVGMLPFGGVLEDFLSAFSGILNSAAARDRVSVSQIDAFPRTYLIWARSGEQTIFNDCLAKELTNLANRRRVDFFLVLNNIDLAPDDPLLPVIRGAKLRDRFGLCCSDVMNYAVSDGKGNPLQSGYSKMVVLNSGSEAIGHYESILAQYGEYDHHEPKIGVMNPHGPWHFPGQGAKRSDMVAVKKKRVTVDDMKEYLIAVQGDNNDTVSLYAGIVGSD